MKIAVTGTGYVDLDGLVSRRIRARRFRFVGHRMSRRGAFTPLDPGPIFSSNGPGR